MTSHLYQMYVTTFVQARSALRADDDERLQAICSEIAARDAIESSVSLLAVSDAEQQGDPRPRAAVLRFFRGTVLAGDAPQDAVQDHSQRAGQRPRETATRRSKRLGHCPDLQR